MPKVHPGKDAGPAVKPPSVSTIMTTTLMSLTNQQGRGKAPAMDVNGEAQAAGVRAQVVVGVVVLLLLLALLHTLKAPAQLPPHAG